MRSFLFLTAVCCWLWTACGGEKPANGGSQPEPKPQPKAEVPVFNPDAAYNYVDAQVKFGPRVPGTPAHAACADWLQKELERLGAKVTLQKAEVERHDGKRLPLLNIIGSFHPERTRRILLCAHWDTRYEADQDPNNPKKQPAMGADDGGSGVGILLEVARVLGERALANIGVDIVLFDVEDQGMSGGSMRLNTDKTWCLGSQYWSRTPHVPGYKADYGILLDMAGASGARFPQESFSREHANAYIQRVWNEAHALGYHDYFVGPLDHDIIDDHVFVTLYAKIPTIDIINLQPGPDGRSRFGHYWHTLQDDMSIIDKSTLKAVGQTLLQVLYKEDAGLL